MSYRCDRCGRVDDEPFECFGIEAMVNKDHAQTAMHPPLIASEWEQPKAIGPDGKPTTTDEKIDDVGGGFALSVTEE
jgi:hypothetical protein